MRSANTDDQARLDIEAYGFWGSHHQRALFDVRVFNPFARSYVTSPICTTYRRQERAKVREYEQRVREIERASFTPLVFSATGGMAPRAKVFYKKLSDLLAVQRKDNYSRTIALVRAMLNFSLLRDAIASLRGAQSAKGRFHRFVRLSTLRSLSPASKFDLFTFFLFLCIFFFSLPGPFVYLFRLLFLLYTSCLSSSSLYYCSLFSYSPPFIYFFSFFFTEVYFIL